MALLAVFLLASVSLRPGTDGFTTIAHRSGGAAAEVPLDQPVRLAAEYAHGGCTMRDGPGDFAQNCFTIFYTGPVVNKLWSYIQSAKFPAFPATVCNATFEISGQLANGGPYNFSKAVQGCSAITNGVVLENLNLTFKPGSLICGRSLWQGSWSNPACQAAPDESSWSGPPWAPHGK
jgi:hypothetical protein